MADDPVQLLRAALRSFVSACQKTYMNPGRESHWFDGPYNLAVAALAATEPPAPPNLEELVASREPFASVNGFCWFAHPAPANAEELPPDLFARLVGGDDRSAHHKEPTRIYPTRFDALFALRVAAESRPVVA